MNNERNEGWTLTLGQLAPMKNIMKDVKDDNNVTNADHNETNEKVDQTKVYAPQSCSSISNKTKATDEQET